MSIVYSSSNCTPGYHNKTTKMRRSQPKQTQPNTQDVDGVYTRIGLVVTRSGSPVRRAAMAWQPREEVAAGTPASFTGCHGPLGRAG